MKQASKIVIIDGLARSGTTLLSSIFHSQENISCYRGICHEFLACNIGKWKKDYALYPKIEKDVEISLNQNNSFSRLFSNKNKKLNLDYKRFCSNSIKTIENRNQTEKLTIEQWRNIFEQNNVTEISDLDKLYQNIASMTDSAVLCFRWNQGYPYIGKFLRNENHYWITIIRHPIDRALSDFRAFNESFENSIRYTTNFAEVISSSKNEKHFLIYFEDLIINPQKTMAKLYDFLGLKNTNINFKLKQQSGLPYKIETSLLALEGQRHTVGENFEGFDKSKIGQSYENVDKKYKVKFERLIQKYGIYSFYH